MKSVHERIKEVRLKLGISQVDFSKRIFFSKSLYGEIEIGNRKVNDRVIQLVSTQFNVNKEWLKTGTGEMFSSPPPDMRLEKLIEIYNELDGTLRDCLIEQSGILLKLQRKK